MKRLDIYTVTEVIRWDYPNIIGVKHTGLFGPRKGWLE